MWPFSYPTVPPEKVGCPVDIVTSDSNRVEYDYIIVGGGTAGCVLASRLSEDLNVNVLLLERGDLLDTWMNRNPLISSDLFNLARSLVAINKSAPIPEYHNRTINIAQAESLGGGTRVNSMIHTRGLPGEYQNWLDLGHKGWGYDDMLPYFKKSETTLTFPEDDSRGSKGPWVNQTFPESPFMCVNRMRAAAESIGIPYHPSHNSTSTPSVCCAAFDLFVDQRRQRVSTYSAFLPESIARKRISHLKICTGAVATRVVFTKKASHSPPRATGVEFKARSGGADGQTYAAFATKEVIICCGAIASPQLLMLSGIGPASHLKKLDIPVTYDSPGVGQYLKDHVHTALMWHVPIEDSFYRLRKPLVAIWELLKYFITGKGLLCSPFVNFGIFLPSRTFNKQTGMVTSDPRDLDPKLPQNRPDIELMPLALQAADPSPDFKFPYGLFSLIVATLQPKSFGTVRLTSSSAFDRPHCDLNPFSHPDDMECTKRGVLLALRLVEEGRAQGYPYDDFKVPRTWNDRDIEAFIRNYSKSTYHYSSSCRMAPLDDTIPGVVDDELRVYGVEGLRVCDTSVFPEIPACHTMAPVVAVAEKCADMMKSVKKYH